MNKGVKGPKPNIGVSDIALIFKNNRGINNPSKKQKHSKSVQRKLKERLKGLELAKEKHVDVVHSTTHIPNAALNKPKKKRKKRTKHGEPANTTTSNCKEQEKLGRKLKHPNEKLVRKKQKQKFEPLTESLLDERFEYHQASDSENFSDLSLFFKNESLDQENCEISCGPLMCNADLPITAAVTEKENISEQRDLSTTSKAQDLPPTETALKPKKLAEPVAKIKETIKFHKIPNSDNFLITMKHPTSLFFQGRLDVKVVLGSLEVLGCTLTNRTKRTTVFSPGGSSLLCLQTVSLNTVVGKGEVRSALESFSMSAEQTQHIVASLNTNEEDCLVVVNKAHDSVSSYLSHCSIYLYPRTNDTGRKYFKEESILHCQFETNKDKISRCYMKPQSWDDLVDEIVKDSQTLNPTRVMVCGGKSVGKSMLLRYMVNRCLEHFKEILFLDFDPGQAEFSVPGSVSVVRVKGPLLGPNFTHLAPQERMVYVGDVDVSKCPDRYMKSAHHIIDYCNSKPEFKYMVWFINTMGFNKGLGVELTTSLIRMANPSWLVQIQSHSDKRNYPELLTPDYVLSHSTRWHEGFTPRDMKLSYRFRVINSAAEKKQRGVPADWGLQPKTARDIVVLSYITQMLKPPRFSLTDVIPYKTSFARLSLSVCNESVHYSQFLSIMNGNLVALCAMEEDDLVLYPSESTMPRVLVQPPVGPCLGFGVVRGVDLAESVIYVITPLSLEQLNTVNCLVKGSVMLPACVYTDSNRGVGHVPYVAVGPGQATSKGVARRFFHPLKN